MKILILLSTLLISSCATFLEHNKKINFPEKTVVTIEVRKLVNPNQDILGLTQFEGDKCIIYLRKYPKCLAHEIRHCFEGDWHQNKKSDEDC